MPPKFQESVKESTRFPLGNESKAPPKIFPKMDILANPGCGKVLQESPQIRTGRVAHIGSWQTKEHLSFLEAIGTSKVEYVVGKLAT